MKCSNLLVIQFSLETPNSELPLLVNLIMLYISLNVPEIVTKKEIHLPLVLEFTPVNHLSVNLLFMIILCLFLVVLLELVSCLEFPIIKRDQK